LVRIKTLEKYSDNWGSDHIRKLIIYNLIDLNFIVQSALEGNIRILYIPDIFPLYKHKKYGYDVKQYEGLVLGILAQLKETKLEIIWHPNNADQIAKMA
jgi:hypothetical protein